MNRSALKDDSAIDLDPQIAGGRFERLMTECDSREFFFL